LFIPYVFKASNAKSNSKTIIAVIKTIVITAIVLFTTCFGVGQITFFSSALKSLKKCLFSFLFFFDSIAIFFLLKVILFLYVLYVFCNICNTFQFLIFLHYFSCFFLSYNFFFYILYILMLF